MMFESSSVSMQEELKWMKDDLVIITDSEIRSVLNKNI